MNNAVNTTRSLDDIFKPTGTVSKMSPDVNMKLDSIFNNTKPATPAPTSSGDKRGLLEKIGEFATEKIAKPLAQGEINTVKALKTRGENLYKDTIKASSEDKGNVLEKGLGAISYGAKTGISAIAGGIGDIFTHMTSPFIPQEVKDKGKAFIQDVVTKYNTRPDEKTDPDGAKQYDKVHEMIGGISSWLDTHPITKDAIKTGTEIASLGAGKEAEAAITPLIKEGTETAGNLIKEGVGNVKGNVDDLTNVIKEQVEQRKNVKFDKATDVITEGAKITPEKAQTAAWEDVQPKLTPNTKEAYAREGNVTEQGMFSKAKITPSDADKSIVDAHTRLYQEGKITEKMPYEQKMDVVDREAAKLHSQQKDFLAKNDKAVNLRVRKTLPGEKGGLFDNLDDISTKNTVPFSRDVTAKGAYDSAMDIFKSKLESGGSAGATKGATTLTKVDEALTSFDNEMEKFGAWEREATGELSEVDKARIQAIRDIHNTARNYIADNLPPNSPWKSIRLEESNMYRIADRMAPKLSSTLGQNKVTQFFKDHPALKRGMLWSAGVVGAGGLAGVGLHAAF